MKVNGGLIVGILLLLAHTVSANSPPTQPTLLYPIGNEQLGERTNITWVPSTDPDNDLMHYVLEYSQNSGADWTILDDEVGRITRFSDNASEKTFAFGAEPQTFGLKFVKDSLFSLAQVNISGIGVPVSLSWKATTANETAAMFPITRVWVNLSGKVDQIPATLTKFVWGLNTIYTPSGRYNLNVCLASNLTDGSCPTLLQQTSVDCTEYINCREDPDFNYALKFPLNLTITSNGQILMFESEFVRTLKRNVPTHEGLMLGLIHPSVERYYPDVPIRLEFDTIKYPSDISLDIGNDGSIEHVIPRATEVPVTLDLSADAFYALLSSCRADYRTLCPPVTVGVNASNGTIIINALRMYYNVTSYPWITNFLPLGNSYNVQIKASDGLNESSYSTSNTFSVAYNPTECEQIPTMNCNITSDTTFLYGDHYINTIAIDNNNTVLDCDGANLISTRPYYTPDIGLSVGGTTNVTVKNCIFNDYHTAITTQKPFFGPSATLYFKEPVYNLTILNNTFENIEYMPIRLNYLNWTEVFIPSQNRTGYRIRYLDTVPTSNRVEGNILKISPSSPIAYFGISVERYAGTVIENNKISNDARNWRPGSPGGYIILGNAPQSRVIYNQIKDVAIGITVWGVTRINETRGNTIIYGNSISTSGEGVHVEGFNNLIINNTLRRNSLGLAISQGSLNNYFYANRMIDNDMQAVDNRNNTFDVLMMGNLWGDYMNDTQGCRDVRPPFGRCDDPYNIDPDSRDRFPIRQGIQFSPDGMPDPIYELPPIITGVEYAPVVIAGDRVIINVSAFGISKLEGFQIALDGDGNPYYVRPETYGVSDPVLSYSIDNPLFTRINNVFAWQTNSSSAGEYNFTVSVSDGETTKSRSVVIQVLPREAMLTVQGLPRIGSQVNLALLNPLRSNTMYVMAFSFSTTPGILLSDGRVIPLNPDPLFLLTLQYPQLINLVGSVGILDAFGRAQASWTIPAVPQLAGVTLYAAYITIDQSAPNSVGSISPAVPITLMS